MDNICQLQFYLNYVGCKEFIKIVRILNLKCFTLTMWDVKVLKNRSGLSDAEFYLNYVGCKAATPDISTALAGKFYLNYVGCKGIHGGSR